MAVAILIATQASRLGAGTIGADTTLQQQIDTSVPFFGWTAVGLFVCFLITVVCFGWLGRRAPGRQSWDAMIVGASPVVLAVGLVSWELFPVALTALGLL